MLRRWSCASFFFWFSFAFILQQVPVTPETAYEILFDHQNVWLLNDFDIQLSEDNQELVDPFLTFFQLLIQERRDNLSSLLHTWNEWMTANPVEYGSLEYLHLEYLHTFLCVCYLEILGMNDDQSMDLARSMQAWRDSHHFVQPQHEILPLVDISVSICIEFAPMEECNPATFFLEIMSKIMESIFPLQD